MVDFYLSSKKVNKKKRLSASCGLETTAENLFRVYHIKYYGKVKIFVLKCLRFRAFNFKNMDSKALSFFQNLHYSAGELSHVKEFVRESGKTIILPYDQFIEHDNRHIDPNPEAGNPDYIIKLVIDSGCNAVVFHYGVAKRFWTNYAGKIPLILKVNGKTSIPSQENALSVHTSFVDDAEKLGASAVGYTLFYGSPRQDEDLPQLANVRR